MAAGRGAWAKKYFGMQLSPAGCVHPHGNTTLLLLPQPDPRPAPGRQQLWIPHSFHQRLRELLCPGPPGPSSLFPGLRATLLLHLHSQGAVMCQALAVVTPGHMARPRRSLGALRQRAASCQGCVCPAQCRVLR